MRGRKSQPFAHIEAPTGGWNTRDSEDNIAPTDALEFDNWWPDIGEVRTRPGYTEHSSTADVVTGDNLISNGGFEDAGGGGADVFADWVESNTNGTIEQSGDYKKADDYSCGLSLKTDVGGNFAQVVQDIVTDAETVYRLQFWSVVVDPIPVHTYGHQYRIYDNTGSADIVAWTEVTPYGEEFVLTEVVFTTPASCISVEIAFKTGAFVDSTVWSYIDVVSVYELSHTPGSVETLVEYISGTDRQMLCADNGEIFDVSTSSPSLLSAGGGETYDNDRWQCANFNGKLVMVNGAEEIEWDGSTLQAFDPVLSGGIGNPIGCSVFKNRMWYWEEDSQDVWYTALNAHAGAVTSFPLSRVGQFGGNLILMESWTRDGGSGPDDFAVFVMSSGEAIVYQGSYPGAAGDWALVGIYNIGEPMGYRSAVKFGGDLFIITKLDIVKMSEVVAGIEARQMETKIVGAHRTAVRIYGDNWGWEAQMYPRGHMGIFNVPVSENTTIEQHVQNTITGAWARFRGITANTWCIFNGAIYFAANDGKIYEFDSGEIDSDDQIESTFQTAWLAIGGAGAEKLFKMVREAYKTNTDITVSNFFATDYRAFSAQPFPVPVDEAGALWDVSAWDTTPWAAGDTIYHEWGSIGAYGEVISMRKRLSTKQRVTFLGSSWLVEIGARL
jgi:hypothetical protein